MTLQDKRSIFQMLAGIIKTPSILSNTAQYDISTDDMPGKFHKIVFGAIYNLYMGGLETISPIEIDSYLSAYPAQYSIYNSNNGIEYLYKLEELGEPENFEYHYQRVKKYTFLRECQSVGIDITDIFDSTVIDLKESEEQQELFDSLSVNEMIRKVENKIVEVKDKFVLSDGAEGSHMSEGVEEMLESLYDTPSYGNSLASGLLTRILRGARRSTLMLRSSITGGGKSRYALADLCTICIPEIWDLKENRWVQTGAKESGLFITTELSKDEIQLPALCYISGIPEWKVLDAALDEEEKERMKRAVKILQESDLHIEHLSDFDIDDITHAIERNVVKHDITHCVFDYIHMSMKLMSNITKNSRVSIREDQILLLLSDKLKQLCNKHDIWMLTGTQLNDSWKQEGNLDASALRGARALGDKLDVGMIMLPITKEDKTVVESIRNAGNFFSDPTHTVTVFKNRRGEYNAVKVFLKIDLGNLRTEDLFVTTMDGELIPDIRPRRIVFKEVAEDGGGSVLDASTSQIEF